MLEGRERQAVPGKRRGAGTSPAPCKIGWKEVNVRDVLLSLLALVLEVVSLGCDRPGFLENAVLLKVIEDLGEVRPELADTRRRLPRLLMVKMFC